VGLPGEFGSLPGEFARWVCRVSLPGGFGSLPGGFAGWVWKLAG
jgi:hypothetical protein